MRPVVSQHMLVWMPATTIASIARSRSHGSKGGVPMKAELTSLVTRRSGSPSITGWKALPGWEGWRFESGSLESWRTKTTVPPCARQWASRRPTLASQSGLLRVPQAGSWKAC